MRYYYIYIMASKSGTLYVGVTGDLQGRVLAHRSGEGSQFTKKYRCVRLVYFETHEYIWDAIEREKELKKWHREQKEVLIKSFNPEWRDLYDEVACQS